jgi:XTP/dITP diphosphohydrolase
MTIVVATRNPDKLREIEAILRGLDVRLVGLDEFGDLPPVIEDRETIEDNALKKARAVRDATGMCALADDTGLEVDALNGDPGVRSARYAGEGAGYEANNRKLLAALAAVPDDKRSARFRCVMALALADEVGERVYRRMRDAANDEIRVTEGASRVDAFVAEGILEGRITREKRGASGFGYDPVFEVPAAGLTLAEMGSEGKNRISHRYRALVEIRELVLRWGLATEASREGIARP